VARAFGIDDDEVVVIGAHLVTHLADREDLFHPGRRIGDEVEGLGEDPDPRDERYPHVEPDVFTQCFFGAVHARREVRMRRADRVLAVHRDEEGLFPPSSRQQCDGRGDGRLSDASLARDEQQTAVGDASQF